MRFFLSLLLSLVFLAQASALESKAKTLPNDSEDSEYSRLAGTAAIEEWVQEFIAQKLPQTRFAVLPLGRDLDGDYFTLQARNILALRAASRGGAVYTRDDEMSRTLLAEIRKGDQFGDTMVADSIQKLGRIQGVQCLIVGRVTANHSVSDKVDGGAFQLTGDRRAVRVRVSLQAYEVETGQLLWGAEKSGLAALPDDPVTIPGTRRQWIVYGTLALVISLLGLALFSLIFVRLSLKHRPR